MLTGLTLGIVAAFFWSLTNIVDKYLTTKYAPEGNVTGILLLSCFFPVVLLPVAYFYGKINFDSSATPLIISGWLMVAWIYFYLRALTLDDASVVMTILVVTPVFSLLISNLILGEWVTNLQLFGGALTLFGAMIVSYNFSHGGFQYPLLVYSLCAAVVMALMLTLFKFGTPGTADVWQSIFWRSFGMISAGIFVIITITNAKSDFINFVREHTIAGLGLNSVNELLTLAGDTLFAIAILFAPIALIQVTESYQPIFIILITLLLARFGLTSVQESYSKYEIIRKGAGIAIVLIGSIFIV